MRHGKAKILHTFCHISNALHHIIFIFICHNPYPSVLILKKINGLYRKADNSIHCAKIKDDLFIRGFHIPEYLFQNIYNLLSVHRLQQILKCMNSKSSCHIIPVSCQINNFYISIYRADSLSCFYAIHSLHVNIKKNRVVRLVIFHQLPSGRKHPYLHLRLPFQNHFSDLLTNIFIIITNCNSVHFSHSLLLFLL